MAEKVLIITDADGPSKLWGSQGKAHAALSTLGSVDSAPQPWLPTELAPELGDNPVPRSNPRQLNQAPWGRGYGVRTFSKLTLFRRVICNFKKQYGEISVPSALSLPVVTSC